jgi:hypothetical protein
MGRLTDGEIGSLVTETNYSEAWRKLGKLGWRDRRRFRLLLKLVTIQDLKAIQWAVFDVKSAIEQRQG